MSDSHILDKVEEFFYFDDSLSETIEAWCQSRCESFQFNEVERVLEHKLEHTALFNEFCEIFTNLIEGFLTNEGIQAVAFYAEIRKQLDRCKSMKEKKSTFANLVLSSIDFNNFCVMMNDVRSGRGFCFCPPLIELDDDTDAVMAQENEMGEDYATAADAKGYYSGSRDEDWKRSGMDTDMDFDFDAAADAKSSYNNGTAPQRGDKYSSSSSSFK